jgi:hypothetical protein
MRFRGHAPLVCAMLGVDPESVGGQLDLGAKIDIELVNAVGGDHEEAVLILEALGAYRGRIMCLVERTRDCLARETLVQRRASYQAEAEALRGQLGAVWLSRARRGRSTAAVAVDARGLPGAVGRCGVTAGDWRAWHCPSVQAAAGDAMASGARTLPDATGHDATGRAPHPGANLGPPSLGPPCIWKSHPPQTTHPRPPADTPHRRIN